MVFLCYQKCSTCNKARKWLDDNGIAVESRDIVGEHPTAEELGRWHQMSGLPLKRFFNTTGIKYRALELKDKLAFMSEEEQLELLSTDGMLVKRPILVGDGFVLVGFHEPAWEARLKAGRS